MSAFFYNKSKLSDDELCCSAQQKTPMLVRPHSQQVLCSAIRSDADFLAKSNIMDYSLVSNCYFLFFLIDVAYRLLVGVDEEHKQISCGLVDTIGTFSLSIFLILFLITILLTGSYTFAKTLEYKAKHGLKPDKDITVIPPAEYQERFVNALEGYFLACPGTLSPCVI